MTPNSNTFCGTARPFPTPDFNTPTLLVSTPCPPQIPASTGLTSKFQSISPFSPYLSLSQAFVFLKCWHSNQPRLALNGLGCTLINTQCLFLSTLLTLFPAGVPHAKNTTPPILFLSTISITFCVNFSQPLFAWEFASWARTV